MAELLVDEHGFRDLVPFGGGGNSLYCLDYGQPDVPVVFVNLDFEPSDPDSKTRIAGSFTEFCEATMQS